MNLLAESSLLLLRSKIEIKEREYDNWKAEKSS